MGKKVLTRYFNCIKISTLQVEIGENLLEKEGMLQVHKLVSYRQGFKFVSVNILPQEQEKCIVLITKEIPSRLRI